jgi:tubulin polyglutamylase TTLL4
MKPCAAARGKGIRMISKKSKVSKKKNYLIMDYISKPHLINGFKYDLRVYVLISG